MQVDHIDGDGLNNCRDNLRVCSSEQNAKNIKVRPGRLKGITPVGSKWQAQIAAEGRHLYLGLFESPELAAKAYDRAARKYHGEFAATNSPC
jgi:hypothetical protein